MSLLYLPFFRALHTQVPSKSSASSNSIWGLQGQSLRGKKKMLFMLGEGRVWSCLMCTELLFGVMKSSRNRQRWRLHNAVTVVNAIGLYTLKKKVTTVSFTYILPRRKILSILLAACICIHH